MEFSGEAIDSFLLHRQPPNATSKRQSIKALGDAFFRSFPCLMIDWAGFSYMYYMYCMYYMYYMYLSGKIPLVSETWVLTNHQLFPYIHNRLQLSAEDGVEFSGYSVPKNTAGKELVT